MTSVDDKLSSSVHWCCCCLPAVTFCVHAPAAALHQVDFECSRPAGIHLAHFRGSPTASRVSARLHALPDHTRLAAGAGHSGAATADEDDLGLCSECWCASPLRLPTAALHVALESSVGLPQAVGCSSRRLPRAEMSRPPAWRSSWQTTLSDDGSPIPHAGPGGAVGARRRGAPPARRFWSRCCGRSALRPACGSRRHLPPEPSNLPQALRNAPRSNADPACDSCGRRSMYINKPRRHRRLQWQQHQKAKTCRSNSGSTEGFLRGQCLAAVHYPAWIGGDFCTCAGFERGSMNILWCAHELRIIGSGCCLNAAAFLPC